MCALVALDAGYVVAGVRLMCPGETHTQPSPGIPASAGLTSGTADRKASGTAGAGCQPIQQDVSPSGISRDGAAG